MGFFNFLDLSSQNSSACNVSFDLTIPHSIRPTPTRRVIPKCFPPSLPLEIVMNILEAAYYDEEVQLSKNMLRSFALVCRDWALPAQKLLFRHVKLSTETACLAFQNAIDHSTERGRVLGNAVLSMSASIDHNQPFGLSQNSFAHAFILCPNLRELSLAVYGCASPGKDIVGSPDVLRMRRAAPSFDEETLSLLKSGPSITALRFSNWSENRQSITQLLGVWTTLKSLVISGSAPELPSPASDPFPCALEELRMNFQTSPSIEFLGWLLHNSSESLRALEFEREPSPAVLSYLIDAHHSSLESLAVPVCSRETARGLDKCSHLRHFSVEDALSSPVVHKKLPNQVEHIAFGLGKDTSLQAVLDNIKTKESLKAVTVHVWNGGELHRQLPSLKMTCAFRGIDLRLTHDIRVFRAIIRGDCMA